MNSVVSITFRDAPPSHGDLYEYVLCARGSPMRAGAKTA